MESLFFLCQPWLPAWKQAPSSLLCTKRIDFKVPKKVQQASGPSPKVDSAAGSGHHQYRACSGMAAGRCECICTHSEAKTFGGWPGVKKGSKDPLLSRKNIRDRLIFCKRYRDWTVEDWSKVIFSDESPFRLFGAS